MGRHRASDLGAGVSKSSDRRTVQVRQQLKLVTDKAPVHGVSQDPVRQVFEHWVFMLGRSPARCKLGPTRRPAIMAALSIYDPGVLMLAVDGLAADPLETCTERMREAMREIEWLLARESRIEFYADKGEALRRRAERRADEVRLAQRTSDSGDPAAAQAAQQASDEARERLRAMAAAMRGAR